MKFDEAYYQRYYYDPDSRAASPQEQQQQADFIAAYVRYLDIQVHSVLDIGCGIGTLLNQLNKAFPEATTQGVEYSPYLCEKFGWSSGSVVDIKTAPADLVICTDVLAYLDDKSCARAIKNLAALTTTALYLSVLTTEDLDIVDTQHTDMQQTPRTYHWYREHLEAEFVRVGGGLFVKKPLTVALWRLEYN